MQAKLDEILRALKDARLEFIGIEHLTDARICAIRDALETEIHAEGEDGSGAKPTVERLLKRY